MRSMALSKSISISPSQVNNIMYSNLKSFVVDLILVLINLIFENLRSAEAEPIGNVGT